MTPSTQRLLDHALAYADRGWPVFPIRPASKAPLTVRGFKDATCDMNIIRGWWGRWPAANVGIATGSVSGLAVVDIDPRSGGDATLELLVARFGKVPDTIRSLTGGGGTHHLFAYREGFRNSAGVLGVGIDTRGDGGYIVVPPSMHASGNTYEWDLSAHPDETPLAAIPDWLCPDQFAAPVLQGEGNLGSFQARAGKADGSPVEPGGRNMALASLAGQWIHQGMSVTDILAAARAWNAANPQPLPDGELDKTVASVCKTHLDKHPAESIPVVTPIEILPEPAADVAEAAPPQPPPAPATAPDFPAHLLQPPGLVGDIVGWINATAIKPQPVLALANALAFAGAVFGRKVRTPTDLRSNLYCLGVAESGSGKDHSRKCVKRICEAAGLTGELLGGEDVSSDAAIYSAVKAHPTLLFQFDEIGHMLSIANGKNAASHQRLIAPTFTKLFSSASTMVLGKQMAHAERIDINQPNACLYGTTVPGRLYEGLSPAEIADGFLGRMLVFQATDPDPMERDVAEREIPPKIIELVQSWYRRSDLPGVGNLQGITSHTPICVNLEPEAAATLVEFRRFCRERKAQTRGDGKSIDVLWSRAVEHATKVALVIACGCEFQSPIISAPVAGYAVELVRHLIEQLIDSVRDSVAGSEHERQALGVLRVIKKAGRGGISRSKLLRTSRQLSSRELNEILNTLVESGRVAKAAVRAPGRGPETLTYRIIKEAD